MNYVEIINFVFTIIWFVLSAMSIYYILLAILGAFFRKKYPKAQVQGKYGVIIPARNEEAVVGNLIKSIQKNQYPQDKLQIFVIAHNCTDQTAQIARELGATVYEYNNPNECTMGYAFRYLFDRIREDYGVENYDGFFLFNADNVLSQNYFEKMNDAFMANHGQCVITSCRNSKNFGSNLMSGLYGMYFLTGCRLESRGRTLINCSTRIQGTGYVINSQLVANGWKYVTLTEDWEFTADQVINGTKIKYCDEAVFYDEQPTTFKVMWRQRVRWSRGHLLMCVTRFGDLVRCLFSFRKRHRDKGSLYDITYNALPVCLISLGVGLAQLICLCFAPCFDIDLGVTLLAWLKSFGITCLSAYLVSVLNAVVVFIGEHKRIQGVSFWLKILITLVWPLFFYFQYIIDLAALFNKNCGWKVIPHTDTTDFEALHQVKNENVTLVDDGQDDQTQDGAPAQNVDKTTAQS